MNFSKKVILFQGLKVFVFEQNNVTSEVGGHSLRFYNYFQLNLMALHSIG